jgi:hypothetical protein
MPIFNEKNSWLIRPRPERDSLTKILYAFLVSFESVEVPTPFYFIRFKILLFSYRIFEYTSFSGEILLSHNSQHC